MEGCLFGVGPTAVAAAAAVAEVFLGGIADFFFGEAAAIVDDAVDDDDGFVTGVLREAIFAGVILTGLAIDDILLLLLLLLLFEAVEGVAAIIAVG